MPDVPLAALVAVVLCYLPPATDLARQDALHHRLPNRRVALLTALTAVGGSVAALVDPAVAAAWPAALVLGLAAGTGAVLLALLAPGVLGMGDAKILPAVVAAATVLGGEVLIGGLLAAALLAGLLGAAVLVRTRDGRTPIPLGPVLLAAPFLGLLGAPVVRAALGG